ncbi:protein adenylyltransferase SelO [Microbulbifer agarilyticus]|uniref:protein adenylyltransferase SelO n=1 Tax=Microbulbifer agarilyticus TaxID=260552 RepID=UPI001CD3E49F|nr:YdiU family protein [Microbulbifer agarilyticus]MCA0894551.1 YdiU family protein [Microbulbifer agarilyticus]
MLGRKIDKSETDFLVTTDIASSLKLQHQYADLGPVFGTPTSPTPLENPHTIHVNPSVVALLGLPPASAEDPAWAVLTSGAKLFPGSVPFAMKYTGHQFGSYNPDLGDGRALLLGEVEHQGQRWDLHLKGAGQTPYSRFGDGRAVLRSTIREYLAGEALTALGIRSTRALSIVASSEPVAREKMETGAALIRVAESHIRFGHFEYLFYTRQLEAQHKLVEHVCAQFLPEVNGLPVQEQAEALLRFTVRRSAELVAGWQSVGFAHGVLNTDNMSIIGDTFDFGPYGFLDDYEPGFICNHSDHTGRYAFDAQPGVVLWNLNALAHAFSSLLDTETLKDCLGQYQPLLIDFFAERMRRKLGLALEDDGDQQLCADLLQILESGQVDYTLFFRALSHYCGERPAASLQALVAPVQHQALDDWLSRYDQRLQKEQRSATERSHDMLRTNPKFVLRNYLAQRVIEAAEAGDYGPLATLFTLLQSPFDEHSKYEDWAAAPPESGKHLPISCSS